MAFMTGAPAARTAALFDRAAAGYDEEFEQRGLAGDLRKVVQATLFAHFPPGAHVLELNCGTGTDAIALAERGVRVTCLDASPEMVARAAEKVGLRSLGHLITTRVLDNERIDSLGSSEFDGAFSNFGGLNCSPRPAEVAAKLGRVVRPGAVFVACLLNRTCLWETAAFLARGKFGKAFRRLRSGGSGATVGGSPLHVWYHSPGGMKGILKPWFEVIELYGLSILSPPPNSLNFISSHPELTGRLLRLDRKIRGTVPFRSLGDHFVAVARRTARPIPECPVPE
jgi:ubiquinone/menaquinone biosynthesis C-methylase UbiE